LNPYRNLAAQCKVLLGPDGFLACELGAGQFEAVRAIFEAHRWHVAEAIGDFSGHERVLRACR
jgi:release factor glutamine methyltransferase